MAVGVDQRVFHVEPLHNTSTGEKRTAWSVETGELADIRELLAEADMQHKRALWKTSPNHPFLAALAGIENHAVLTKWLNHPGLDLCFGPIADGSGILRLYLDNFASPFAPVVPEVGLTSVMHVAALAAAGFPIHPQIMAGGVFSFPKQSVMMPPLTAQQCIGAANMLCDPKALAVPDLPGYPAGQHPFCYAFSACLNLRLLGASEASAWKAPTHFFPGRGTRCAIATDAALRRPGFQKQVENHIAGLSA